MPLLPHSTKLTNAIVFSLQPLWLNECRGKYVDCEIGAKQLHFDSIDNDLHKEWNVLPYVMVSFPIFNNIVQVRQVCYSGEWLHSFQRSCMKELLDTILLLIL